MPYCWPQKQKDADACAVCLKFFVGAVNCPDIIVKSDCDGAIILAVKNLGWHPEPGLPNKFPHNAHLERFVETMKSLTRSNTHQCGGNSDCWHSGAQHACIAYAVTQKAPILLHMKREDGTTQPGWKYIESRTIWENHH